MEMAARAFKKVEFISEAEWNLVGLFVYECTANEIGLLPRNEYGAVTVECESLSLLDIVPINWIVLLNFIQVLFLNFCLMYFRKNVRRSYMTMLRHP